MRSIVGIDEVGRGALAGPVVVAAVVMPQSLIRHKLHSRIFANKNLRSIREVPLRDSKKLSAKQREAWFEYFKTNPKVEYALARVYPRQIEKRNISRAANLAAERAYKRLIANRKSQIAGGRPKNVIARPKAKQSDPKGHPELVEGSRSLAHQTGSFTLVQDDANGVRSPRPLRGLAMTEKGGNKHRVYLDGGLYIGNGEQPKNARTVVRGDEKVKAIAAASIIAKVSRDRGMVRLAKKYLQYGFEAHKGYGTRAHMRAIRRHGPSKAHRSTFLKSC